MKIDGRISILISRDSTSIEIKDEAANVTFVKVKLTPEQLSAALSRQANIECELDIRGLDKVGKTHENSMFTFVVPNNMTSSDHEQLREMAQSKLTNGWIADSYFSSQNSFYESNGERYARCVIRRWL